MEFISSLFFHIMKLIFTTNKMNIHFSRFSGKNDFELGVKTGAHLTFYTFLIFQEIMLMSSMIGVGFGNSVASNSCYISYSS